ncbi:hypothetical protein VTN31DRAFT_5455 [Thermomyces dupontii]|uniref:uncharacterized protein n=1 Tax=Talaromyces thermophilus TaxID=28565 RepID=UPI00374205F5
MTTWVFDRSGCYSAGPFNIHKQPERFIRVIAGYTVMDEEQLGLDTFIKRDGDGQFVRFKHEGGEVQFEVQRTPLIRQRAIVSRGTTCFLSRKRNSKDWEYVTKFSWTPDRRESEATLLQRANERGVEGIARLEGHCNITRISEMRSEMAFRTPYTFRGTSDSIQSRSVHSSSPNVPSSKPGSWTSAVNSSERSNKRKSPSALPESKRSQPKGNFASASNPVTFEVQENEGTSLFAAREGDYDDRIFRCLVIFPAGRPIYEYRSPLELVQALRDAIKAHWSLYSVGNILHPDISENNIIITDRAKTGFAGMLIDMDLAKELGQGPSGARRRTGTMEFMAIEVLMKKDHTYRHDLESFFYVLIWQCARRGWEFVGDPQNQPLHSHLTKWYTGTFEDIAFAKASIVDDAKRFDYVLDKEFPPELESLKPLCRSLRRILFPFNGDEIFTGTPKNPKVLYVPMLKAFDKAISDLGGQ